MTSTAIEKASTNNGVAIDYGAVLTAMGLNPRDPKTQAVVLICERYDLDPVLKHVILVKGNVYITRDGLLTVAHRSGMFDGIEVLDQGADQTHYTAKVAVHRKDMSHPFTYVGRYPKAGGNKEYAPEMAVKCAEVAALRRAFNVTGISPIEERWDVTESPVVASTPPPGVDGDTGELLEASATTVRRAAPKVAPPQSATNSDALTITENSTESKADAEDDVASVLGTDGDEGDAAVTASASPSTRQTPQQRAAQAAMIRVAKELGIDDDKALRDEVFHAVLRYCTNERVTSLKDLTESKDANQVQKWLEHLRRREAHFYLGTDGQMVIEAGSGDAA